MGNSQRIQVQAHRASSNTEEEGIVGPQQQLWNAASKGDAAAVKEMLAIGLLNVNWKDNYNGWTPIFIAAKNGHEDTVILLANSGADVNLASNRFGSMGWTPLHAAAYGRHVNIVRELINHGALVLEDYDGDTPLYGATGEIKEILEDATGLRCDENPNKSPKIII